MITGALWVLGCQLVGEVGGACHVPPGDSRAEELHVLQGAAGDVLGETAAHDLDLGEFRHPVATSARSTPPPLKP